MNPVGNTFNIQEHSKNEWATIGSSRGLLVRWGWSGGVDQLFTFEPWELRDPPQLQSGKDPGQIGDIPRVTDIDKMPPEQSTAEVIGEIAVPSALVHDGRFSNKLIQFQRSPYYILRREEYWDRTGDNGYYHDHGEGEQRTKKVELFYQVTIEATETEEKTFGVEFSVTGGVNFLGNTVNISTKVSNALKVTKMTHERIVTERLDNFEVEYKSEVPRCVFVCWSLVDKYTLLRVTGDVREPMQTWTVPQYNTKKVDSFPPNSVTVDGRPVEELC